MNWISSLMGMRLREQLCVNFYKWLISTSLKLRYCMYLIIWKKSGWKSLTKFLFCGSIQISGNIWMCESGFHIPFYIFLCEANTGNTKTEIKCILRCVYLRFAHTCNIFVCIQKLKLTAIFVSREMWLILPFSKNLIFIKAIHFLQCCVFIAVPVLSLLVASGGYSLLLCMNFPFGSFSCWRARASAAVACKLSGCGSQALEDGLSNCGK